MAILLKELSFEELNDTPNYWRLDNFSFRTINLIVGKNSSGKTRSLNVINGLSRLLSGSVNPLFRTGTYDARFEIDGILWRYQLELQNRAVVNEALNQGRRTLLKRGAGGTGTIYAEQLGKKIQFQTPDTQLAIAARQDSIQHPFLAPLAQWAQSVVLFSFGGPLGKQSMLADAPQYGAVDRKNTNNVIPIYADGFERFGPAFDEAIITDMKSLDYDLSEVGIGHAQSLEVASRPGINLLSLFVAERNIGAHVDQGSMSQGMFRALSVIIQLNYAIFSNETVTILIDDIGEGLDFDRSRSLIKLIISKAAASNDQVIMTTNDRFVMNAVPLEYWSILTRHGHVVTVQNSKNSKRSFEDFNYTGLSNFDFFASNFAAPGRE